MQVGITLYQTQRDKLSRLTPMCPGLFGWSTVSRDAGKARERALDRLRREIRKLPPSDVQRLFIPPGRRLERVHLELKLVDAGDKKHVAGWFPVVVEPRDAGGQRELQLGYHPLRPAEWFELDPELPLSEQVLRAYRRIFGPEDDLELVKCEARDKLISLRFDAEPPSLLSLLEGDDRTQAMLGAGASGRLDELLRVAVNFTARAAEGRLRPGVPREGPRRRLQQLLCGAVKTPVLVVGPPGSGKSSVIVQAVFDLLEAEDYPSHRNLDRVHNVLSLRGRHVIAGMSYVGQWEARCVALLERAKRRRLVLWSDDVHAWGSIGKTTVSERALADFFRGPVSRRELCVIGECTPDELVILEHEAPALAAAFARVHIEPTGPSETLAMMLHESRRLERELRVEFDPRCFRRIVDLATTLTAGSTFPGKALAPLAALARAQPAGSGAIVPEHVVRLFSRQTGLPEILLSPDAPLEREALSRELSQQIVGQPAALDAACDLVLSIRARACASGRPYGVFLFTGPTGTGKTELAKCIAEYLYGDANRLVRFDMGELSTADAASRLIGDRAEPEGLLTRAVRAQPFSLLLLDEIEKAHPAVLNLMLQIFDDGRLTDARGAVTDFTHTVIIMTSNLGASKRTVRGFADDPAAARAVSAEVAQAVREFFPPELFNRIDRVVPFEPLGKEAARGIAKKELARLAARPGLAERNVFLKFTGAVVDRVVDEGYSADYGARALKRYIDRGVGDLLTAALTRETGAEMRLLWLYRPARGIAVHAESLREADPVSSEGPVAALLAEDATSLSRRVPDAVARLRAIEAGGELAALERALAGALERFRAGEKASAEPIFSLDALRAHVRDLTRRLERRIGRSAELQELERRRKRAEGEPILGEDFTTVGDAFGKLREAPGRRPKLAPGGAFRVPRNERLLLADLAEVLFLEHTLAAVEDAGRHVASIELTRLAAHHERRRFSGGNPGLLEWLARAYAGARGHFDGAAAALPDGTIRAARSRPELEELLESRPGQVALRLIGPSVADFFGGETGCHVRRTAGSGPEIVRVTVARGGGDPESALRDHAERRARFEAALESEGELPRNPEALLPVVRSIRWDPEPQRATRAWVEDYTFSHVVSRRVRSLDELLRDLWLLAAGRGSA